jgi:hypothetical protein
VLDDHGLLNSFSAVKQDMISSGVDFAGFTSLKRSPRPVASKRRQHEFVRQTIRCTRNQTHISANAARRHRRLARFRLLVRFRMQALVRRSRPTEAHTKHFCNSGFRECFVHVVRHVATDEHECVDIGHLESSFVCVFELI